MRRGGIPWLEVVQDETNDNKKGKSLDDDDGKGEILDRVMKRRIVKGERNVRE